MTDRGTRARWTTAALVAPTAAALFAGTTAWAAGHQPETPKAKSAPATQPAPTTDPVVEQLQAAIESNTAQVEQLRVTVDDLKAQAAAIAKGAPVKAGSTRSSSSRSSARSSSTRTVTVTKTTTVKKKAAAPAPATQTTTGASGK